MVLRPGWEEAWAEVLRQLDDVLPDRVKRQAACEVIMLTHNRDLHEVNLGWHPRAEDVLWQPALQQGKRSENGALNVRYTQRVKAEAVQTLRGLVAAHAPWLRIRYAFWTGFGRPARARSCRSVRASRAPPIPVDEAAAGPCRASSGPPRISPPCRSVRRGTWSTVSARAVARVPAEAGR